MERMAYYNYFHPGISFKSILSITYKPAELNACGNLPHAITYYIIHFMYCSTLQQSKKLHV